MQELLVATRKGLIVVGRDKSGWRPGRPHFPGEPVTQVLADPHDGGWYAALRLGHFGVKLKRSVDRGASWQDVASPAFPPKPARCSSTIPCATSSRRGSWPTETTRRLRPAGFARRVWGGMRSARPPPGDRLLCVFRQRIALRVVVDPARPGREGVFSPSPLPSRRPHPGEGGGREPRGRAGPEASDLSLEQDGLRHRPTPARPHPAATQGRRPSALPVRRGGCIVGVIVEGVDR